MRSSYEQLSASVTDGSAEGCSIHKQACLFKPAVLIPVKVYFQNNDFLIYFFRRFQQQHKPLLTTFNLDDQWRGGRLRTPSDKLQH